MTWTVAYSAVPCAKYCLSTVKIRLYTRVSLWAWWDKPWVVWGRFNTESPVKFWRRRIRVVEVWYLRRNVFKLLCTVACQCLSAIGQFKAVLTSTKLQRISADMSIGTFRVTSEAHLKVRLFLVSSATLWLSLAAIFVPIGAANNVTERRPYRPTRFRVEELINTRFASRISDDIDLDPCKGGKTRQLCDNNSRLRS